MDADALLKINPKRLELEYYKKNYLAFVKAGWKVMFPNLPFKHGWHIDCLADHLQAAAMFQFGKPVTPKQARHTLFSLPPRHTKSTFCSHFYIPWLWLHNPGLEIITCAYKLDRAMKDSDMSLHIMQSQWYRDLVAQMHPDLQWTLTSKSKQRIINSKGGQRLCAGRGGGIAGENADMVIIDDSLHPMEANSDVALIQLETWWREAISMRFNDPSKGQFIIIGQRLNERDSIGIVMDPEGGEDLADWNRIVMPSLYELDHPVPFVSTIPMRVEGEFTGPVWEDPRSKPGELLFEEHYSLKELKKIKRRIGARAWASQHQGRPAPSDGDYFRRRWFKMLPLEEWQKMERPEVVIQSWDTAFTPKKLDDAAKGMKSSDSVCTTWYLTHYKGRPKVKYIVLAHMFVGRLNWPQLRKKAIALHNKWKPQTIVIEDQASGKSLCDELDELGLPIERFQPRGLGDKKVRASMVTTFFENGAVLLPDWKPEFTRDENGRQIMKGSSYDPEHFIKALTSFPNAGKDITDSTSQALLHLRRYDIQLDYDEDDDQADFFAGSAYESVDNKGTGAYSEVY